MKTIKFLAAAAAVMAVFSCKQPSSIEKMKAEVEKDAEVAALKASNAKVDSVSYLLGVNYGMMFKGNGFFDEMSEVNMDELKKGITLRSFGQHNPVVEYRMEGFDMFEVKVNSIKEDFVKACYNVTVQTSAERKNVMGSGEGHKDEFADEPMMAGDMPEQTQVPERERRKPETVRRDAPKVGRNDPCPCGSGKKYKHCCGRNE